MQYSKLISVINFVRISITGNNRQNKVSHMSSFI